MSHSSFAPSFLQIEASYDSLGVIADLVNPCWDFSTLENFSDVELGNFFSNLVGQVNFLGGLFWPRCVPNSSEVGYQEAQNFFIFFRAFWSKTHLDSTDLTQPRLFGRKQKIKIFIFVLATSPFVRGFLIVMGAWICKKFSKKWLILGNRADFFEK